MPSVKQNVEIENMQVAVELTLNGILKDVFSSSSSRILRFGLWHHHGDSDGCTYQVGCPRLEGPARHLVKHVGPVRL